MAVEYETPSSAVTSTASDIARSVATVDKGTTTAPTTPSAAAATLPTFITTAKATTHASCATLACSANMPTPFIDALAATDSTTALAAALTITQHAAALAAASVPALADDPSFTVALATNIVCLAAAAAAHACAALHVRDASVVHQLRARALAARACHRLRHRAAGSRLRHRGVALQACGLSLARHVARLAAHTADAYVDAYGRSKARRAQAERRRQREGQDDPLWFWQGS